MKGKQSSETKLNEHLRIFFSDRLAEKATPEYFEGMLGQIHRRLRQDLVGRPSRWDRLAELFAPFLPEIRPLLVRYALPLILFGAVAGFALQHDRLQSTIASRDPQVQVPQVQVALQAGGPPSIAGDASLGHLASMPPDLLRELRAFREPSAVAAATESGTGDGRATKAKDRENGGRSFVSVLPVRYEASVDF